MMITHGERRVESGEQSTGRRELRDEMMILVVVMPLKITAEEDSGVCCV